MEFIIAPIVGIVDYLITFNICEAFMKQKVSNLKKYGLVFITAVLMNTTLTLISSGINILEFFACSIINTGMMMLIYSGSMVVAFLSVAISYFINLLGESIVLVFLIYLLDANLETILYSVPLWLIFACSARAIMYVITFVFSKWWKAERSITFMSKGEWIHIILLWIVSSITTIIVILYYYNSTEHEIYLLVFIICVFVANIIILNTTSKLSERRRIEQDNILLRQQVKLSMENVESLLNNYSEQRKITHDFNNHLSTINSLLDNGNIEKAKEYVASISNKNLGKSILFSSNNSVVDVLLTQKYNIAKQNGISMQVKIDELSALPMKDEDIVVVFSNMLDNAIDAAKQCTAEKTIKVKFVKESDGYILSVHNTANNNFEYSGQDIVTTKEDKLSHGYGIKNIKTILEKYGYDYAVSNKDGKVSFTVLIG